MLGTLTRPDLRPKALLRSSTPQQLEAAMAQVMDEPHYVVRDGRGWPDLITQPAYMVPFAIDPGPRRSASRRPTSRKVGGPVQYHYQIIQTARMNMNPWAYSAENFFFFIIYIHSHHFREPVAKSFVLAIQSRTLCTQQTYTNIRIPSSPRGALTRAS